jgi:anaerobic selenocysteine-containing dehydrogenase
MKTKRTIEKSFCRLCWSRCAVDVTIENGKVTKVTADKSFPGRRSTPCIKGLYLPELLNHPQRVIYPMKRTGDRGEGKWARISWDEGLGYIADTLNSLKARFGAESVAIGLPSPRGLEMFVAQRFASAFGTPNVSPPSHVCHVPRMASSNLTYGAHTAPDNETLPNCLVVWGSNFLNTRGSSLSYSLDQLTQIREKTKLIVIDPQKTRLASMADIWLRLRPGSDGFLAIGMLKIIIEEGLFDERFVADWTIGFQGLKDHLQHYSLDEIAEKTWVPKEQIIKAARLYTTTGPAAIDWGNALDQTHSSIQVGRAISILRATTGNLNIPGGDIIPSELPITPPGEMTLIRSIPRDKEKTLGNEFKLATNYGIITRQSLISSMLDKKPYQVKAFLSLGSDPLLTYPESRKTYKALAGLELLAVSELFMTPVAELADIVLPVSANFEYNEIASFPFVTISPKLIESPGECWSDIKIINELARKAGLGDYFWNDEEEILDAFLKPSGLTFEQSKEKRIFHTHVNYRAHEKSGFKTRSGKVELFSETLQEMGYSPLPTFIDIPEDADYPLTLTSAKNAEFVHSAHRNIPSLRKASEGPIVKLNPATASVLGLTEGSWVNIETKNGKIKQQLVLDKNIDRRVVIASYGWWFPEKDRSKLYGWDESNINILTSYDPPHDPAMGSINLRGIPCKVYGD